MGMVLSESSTYKPLLLRKFEISGDIVGRLIELPVSLLGLKKIPINVAEDSVQSHGASLGKPVLPILGRNPLRVHLTANDNIRLSMKPKEA